VKSGELTAAFNAVLDKTSGDIFCGVSDMKVLEEIPKAHLEQT
jgi:hypothetical protein